MDFNFDKAQCQNLRKSLRFEWLETNGLGDYASSSIVGCNTRKYHGLFVGNLDKPAGRYVLLSALEEEVVENGAKFPISSRQHPGNFYPHGHEYLRGVTIGAWPRFRYRVGDIILTREILMPRGRHCTLTRYSAEQRGSTRPDLKLIVRPLLAYRNFHQLTKANMDLRVKTWPAPSGFKIAPYEGMPELYMQTDAAFAFYPSPDWYYNVEYLMEHERGFSFTEDLFMPGEFELSLSPDKPAILCVSPDAPCNADGLARLWDDETKRRLAKESSAQNIAGHLAREGEKFLFCDSRNGRSVMAGFPWFDAWGRDTMIALPGLTFCADRAQDGVDILNQTAQNMKGGIVPNVYAADGESHSYNSADASLWYVWAVQQMVKLLPTGLGMTKEHCWQAVRDIIAAYSTGRAPGTRMDDAGLLFTGSPDTQLTWMDATVNGRPVTPRWGCAVELNALWYNALCFENKLATTFGGNPMWDKALIAGLKKEFIRRFWDDRRGYLADVWRPEGADWSFRPNQIFAASLPEPLLERPEAAEMVGRVRTALLTPYGLRTLSPADPAYRSRYEGSPEERDSAYHQGTVWPWLLGAYTDAVMYSMWDHDIASRHILDTITPLLGKHLRDYGVGSIPEIFDAAPPTRPNGTPFQAWSVAEVLRALRTIQLAAPGEYRRWEAKLKEEAM